MLLLLGTALTTSFFDCLNPSAIAQQMALQGMVRRKRQALFFTAGIGMTNYFMGLAIYYGVAAWASRLFKAAWGAWPDLLFGVETAAAVGGLLLGARSLRMAHQGRKTGEEPCPKAALGLSPVSLFVMGAAFCGVELTSALPYFSFLGVLAGYQLSLPLVLLFVGIYNLVYVAPLLLVYVGYNRLRGTRQIQRLERGLQKVSAYVVPVALLALGALLAGHAAWARWG